MRAVGRCLRAGIRRERRDSALCIPALSPGGVRHRTGPHNEEVPSFKQQYCVGCDAADQRRPPHYRPWDGSGRGLFPPPDSPQCRFPGNVALGAEVLSGPRPCAEGGGGSPAARSQEPPWGCTAACGGLCAPSPQPPCGVQARRCGNQGVRNVICFV